jgi:DMSO reductase family type II enzyme heme b subunit
MALLLVGGTLGFLNVPLASSAATTIIVAHVNEAVPLDPQAAVWNQAQESTVPLSSQQIYQPGGGTTRAVRVRTIEDGINIGFLVSWDDDTRNDTTGMVPSDSAAIQLPIDPTHLPYQCMGQSANRVNIWQWKAALEREGKENIGSVGAGVRNLTSNGICKAVDTPGIDPEVQSYHDGKQWHVVFRRSLSKGGPGTAPLTTNLSTSAAFAVWNGAKGEAKGMKAVSSWNTVQYSTADTSNAASLVTLGAVILISAGAVVWAMRRMAGG